MLAYITSGAERVMKKVRHQVGVTMMTSIYMGQILKKIALKPAGSSENTLTMR